MSVVHRLTSAMKNALETQSAPVQVVSRACGVSDSIHTRQASYHENAGVFEGADGYAIMFYFPSSFPTLQTIHSIHAHSIASRAQPPTCKGKTIRFGT